eukprot:scpid71709/ scgid9969/ 
MSHNKISRAKLMDQQANFAAWKEKKDEEARAARRREAEQQQDAAEEVQAKRVNGHRAYALWKTAREEELQRSADERRKLERAARMVEEESEMFRQATAEQVYTEWKEQKSWERKELSSRQSTRSDAQTPDGLYLPTARAATPSYGSFCSVWASDVMLGRQLQRRSPRPSVDTGLPYILRERMTLPGRIAGGAASDRSTTGAALKHSRHHRRRHVTS